MGRKSPPAVYSPGESKSVSCRKIENGYIISESHSGKDGYSSCERFSATKPKLEVSAGVQHASGGASRPKTSSLGAAGKYLARK
jgi:hypothetical protein